MGGLGILGGVGLTLFGMRFLRKGLDRLLGGSLLHWVARVTQNRWRAFGAGVALGVVAPSSTGLAVLSTQWLGDGERGLKAPRVLAVLLGANVGLTVTAHLFALPVATLALLMIVVGVVGFQFCRRELWRGLGQCTLALGFVFLALGMISNGAAEIAKVAELREGFRLLGHHSMVLVGVVAVLAVLLQSSTATIALGLVLAQSDLLTPSALLCWVLGTNLGLGVTSMIAGWHHLDSRRLGLENTIAKLAVAFVVLGFVPMIQVGLADWPLPQQAAVAHTVFNLLVALVALPWLEPLHRLGCFVLPAVPLAVGRETFLESGALDVPSLALAHATRETLLMADRVRDMLMRFQRALLDDDVGLARAVQKEDDVLDRMNLEIKDYLSRMGGLRAEDVNWQFALLAFSNELEAVGDLIDKHLCDALLKRRAAGVPLQPADQAALAEAYRRALAALELATGVLTTRDLETAGGVLAEKQRFNEWCRRTQHEHYARLSGGSREALAGSAYFLDALNALRRINSHVSVIGYIAMQAR